MLPALEIAHLQHEPRRSILGLEQRALPNRLGACVDLVGRRAAKPLVRAQVVVPGLEQRELLPRRGVRERKQESRRTFLFDRQDEPLDEGDAAELSQGPEPGKDAPLFAPTSKHKLANLDEHCPAHARPEMRRDYRGIVNATDGIAARKAYDAFVAKWSKLCPAVARSLEEAGLELLTFYEFPKAMWRSLRTTNPLENLNREFRRRTKTQASFSQEASAVTLLYGLVAFGQISMHKINGHRELKALVAKMDAQAA